MKTFVHCAAVAACLIVAGCQSGNQQSTPSTRDEKAAYSLGANMGRAHERTITQIQSVQSDFNLDMYMQGIRDRITGQLQMTDDEMRDVATDYQREYIGKIQAQKDAEAAQLMVEAKKFLDENAKKEGVKQTDSGLQYMVLEEGAGKQAQRTDYVLVNYRGTLVDGTEFDSSYKKGEPAKFKLSHVIPGWTEGIAMMKEGAKYRLFIAPELAYGDRGRAPTIPPNAVLIFDVELVKVIGENFNG